MSTKKEQPIGSVNGLFFFEWLNPAITVNGPTTVDSYPSLEFAVLLFQVDPRCLDAQ